MSITPARQQPAVPHVPSYLGTRHPAGPGINPLPAPPGIEVVGITDDAGVVLVQVAGVRGAFWFQVAARLYALADRLRRPVLRRVK